VVLAGFTGVSVYEKLFYFFENLKLSLVYDVFYLADGELEFLRQRLVTYAVN
jgi:hypothetical protein